MFDVDLALLEKASNTPLMLIVNEIKSIENADMSSHAIGHARSVHELAAIELEGQD